MLTPVYTGVYKTQILKLNQARPKYVQVYYATRTRTDRDTLKS